MDLTHTGIVLRTENYDACLAFYRDVLELPEVFTQEEESFRLTCLSFGGAYLLVETGAGRVPSGEVVRAIADQVPLQRSRAGTCRGNAAQKGPRSQDRRA